VATGHEAVAAGDGGCSSICAGWTASSSSTTTPRLHLRPKGHRHLRGPVRLAGRSMAAGDCGAPGAHCPFGRARARWSTPSSPYG
jgi:hypothetical protein